MDEITVYKLCPICNTENIDGRRECEFCGYRLVIDVDVKFNSPTTREYEDDVNFEIE